MIITKLIGGLGNQMFQYAAGRRTAIANNTELKLDITGYDHQVGITPRVYMLDIFHIHASIATKQEVKLFNTNSKGFVQRHWRQLKLLLFQRHYIRQRTTYFTNDFLSIPNNSYLDGYWGSEKYFADVVDIIRKDFTLKNKPDKYNIDMIRRITNGNSVSIHIRRGDYILDEKTNKHHGVCNLDYYLKAVDLIAKKVKKPFFFIFSDDIKWAKQNLRLKFPCVYVDHNIGEKDCEDMRLMDECKHNVIANSSFSWWGAWLNKNKNKIVIAPKRWFTDKSINTEDLLPDSWIRI